jgi:putative glutamine amidotransferase
MAFTRRSVVEPSPLVGIPADYRILAGAGVHTADESYIRAVSEQAGAIPVVIPVLPDGMDFSTLLAGLDGILLSGSQSNVMPARYGGKASAPGTMHDPGRDAQNLPLIKAAVAAGIPLLAICRGFQEMNVAYGGSLHQKLQELPGRIDHRAPTGQPVDVAYDMAHAVTLSEGGLLRRLLGTEQVMVNSVHWQGVDRLAEGLTVEAVAPDGTIEAIRITDAPGFALGVQWHPEHRPTENPVSRAIFSSFRAAVAERAAQRRKI